MNNSVFFYAFRNLRYPRYPLARASSARPKMESSCMTDSLADLDTLVLRCRAERSRDYVSESIQCYKAGAYRSAIVNVWIAVVFDLVDKIRDLALAGDARAQRINSRYETYIDQINAGNDQGVKNALEFERTIIGTCGMELGFFDHQQMRDLQGSTPLARTLSSKLTPS